ncbi:PH domain-containing protein [Porphyrobacter sp. GA68]|uniref:PH domain-containing protein n=1 Tax=Porphyrobacter sp. GA68 TaxID=2883480 RepID=UPI001D180DEF|nr:PH domain-containing protein [Porphyrobacter sp. GA68]
MTEPPEGSDAEPLHQLHHAYVKVLRISGALLAAPLVAAAAALEMALPTPPGLLLSVAVVVAALLLLRVPFRRYNARGYHFSEDRLRVVSGLLFRSDTVVPFGRVQHIDVAQGPLERAYGLATLTLHTAGTHNASVSLPGLLHADALAMRERIRARVKRDTM